MIRDLLDLEEQSVVESILADAQWSELQRLGSKAQKDRIAVAMACKTIAFARLLLGELRNSPSWEEAERIASLIAASIHAMDPIEFDDAMRNDLRGETMIELANSRRRATEWKRSEEALSKASGFLSRGSGDRRLLARLYAISASLEADRGNTESALVGFNQCKELYTEIGARDLVARALIQIADTLSEPNPRAGLLYLDEAAEYLTERDPLILNAKLLRVDCLVWTGQLREACHWLLECERPHGGRMLIRHRFIGARLLHSLGYAKEAERLLNDVVTDDLENELFKDALLDLLYILKVHLAEDNREKAAAVCRRALAEPILAEFSHDQLKVVWRQILGALEASAILDSGLLASLKLYLSLHWRNPAPHTPSLFSSERHIG